jgi:hypothetical protein
MAQRERGEFERSRDPVGDSLAGSGEPLVTRNARAGAQPRLALFPAV